MDKGSYIAFTPYPNFIQSSKQHDTFIQLLIGKLVLLSKQWQKPVTNCTFTTSFCLVNPFLVAVCSAYFSYLSENDFFLENYVTSEGDRHNVVYYNQQLSIAR